MWYVVCGPLARRFAKMHSGMCAVARAHPFSYHGNGLMDFAEIWFVAGEPLAMHFTHDGEYLHEHMGHTF